MDKEFDPLLYNSFFHNNVCHVCKKMDNLSRCSKCKTMIYCSKNHQEMDWKYHKKFCKAMAHVLNLSNKNINNFNDYMKLKTLRYELIKHKLNRDLCNIEYKMVMYTRYCEVCFNEDVTIDCHKCRNVFYCSEEHKSINENEHLKYCKELELNLKTELNNFSNNLKNYDFAVCDIPKYINELPGDLIDLINICCKDSTDLKQNIMNYSCISPIASILYGLQRCGVLQNRLIHKNKFCIHIVGSNMYEMGFQWKHMFELAFHWIHNLVHLEFIIVGPELLDIFSSDNLKDNLCSSCTQKGVEARLSTFKQLYEKVNTLSKPDTIVCFNSGIHISDSNPHVCVEPEHHWKNSLKYLLQNGIPLLLTAYTLEEINGDVKVIESNVKNVDVLVEPQKNPFCDKNPLRDFTSQSPPVYYINGYISVLSLKS